MSCALVFIQKRRWSTSRLVRPQATETKEQPRMKKRVHAVAGGRRPRRRGLGDGAFGIDSPRPPPSSSGCRRGAPGLCRPGGCRSRRPSLAPSRAERLALVECFPATSSGMPRETVDCTHPSPAAGRYSCRGGVRVGQVVKVPAQPGSDEQYKMTHLSIYKGTRQPVWRPTNLGHRRHQHESLHRQLRKAEVRVVTDRGEARRGARPPKRQHVING